jgi:WD40 repeat protein
MKNKYANIMRILVGCLLILLLPLSIITAQGGITYSATNIALSPDGSLLAVTGRSYQNESGEDIFAIDILDAITGQVVVSLDSEFSIRSVSWSSDNSQIVTSNSWGPVEIWTIADGSVIGLTGGGAIQVRDVQWSPVGGEIAFPIGIGIDIANTNGISHSLVDNDVVNQPTLIAWAPDGTRIASVGGTYLRIWDLVDRPVDGKLLNRFDVGSVNALAWHPDGTQVVVSNQDGLIRLLDVTNGQEITSFNTGVEIDDTLALNPTGEQIALSMVPHDIAIWDISSGTLLKSFPIPTFATTLSWSGDGTRLYYNSFQSDGVYVNGVSLASAEIPLLFEQPLANAGIDQLIMDVASFGSEAVTLDGSASTDPDGTIVSYSWTENDVEIATGPTPTVDLAVGEHTITLTVTDDDGLTASDTVVITVQAASTSARVTANLQALYTFDEGGGLLINDVSGVGAPMGLTIDNQYAVTWSADGLTLNSATVIDSRGPATKFINAARATNALTIEAWVTPSNITQDGPARMVTLSPDIWERNITLGQGLWPGQPNDTFDIRLRTTDTSDNGQPSITSPSGAASTNLTHLVYTRDAAGTATLYVNNVPVVSDTVAGDFSNWDTSYRLALGNEVTLERPWLGTYHLVALYDQALTPAEVEQNFNAGSQAQGTQSPPPAPTPMPTPTLNRVTSGLQAFYTFDEGSGYFIHDNAGANTGLDLVIDDVNMVNWTTGGLTLTAPAMLKTSGPATGIINAAQSTNEVTLEAWLQPTTTAQNGPARLISLSEDLYNRNFTLGHGIWSSFDTAYTVRLRTTDTSMDGQPPLETGAGAITGNLTHVVYTRDAAGNAALYVDGALVQTHTVTGDFSNWDASYRLLLGSELTHQRTWSGTYYLAAIYNRALTAAEVQQNYAAGHGS